MAVHTPPASLPVTVVIPTRDEEDRLPACLAALGWAGEVIVADGGSRDGTVALARAAGARVLTDCGPTIAHQRNAAIAAARHEWVLAVDADERVTPELVAGIAAAIAAPTADAYRVHFRNHYLGREVTRGSWARDYHPRLFRRHLRFRTVRVHEGLDVAGPLPVVAGRLDHHPYRDLLHHLEKGNRYSRWGAEDLLERGARISVGQLVLRPFWRFVKYFVLDGLWRDGRHGLVFSAVHAWVGFTKYALLWDLHRRAAAGAAVARPAPRPAALPTPLAVAAVEEWEAPAVAGVRTDPVPALGPA